jgi:phosphatidylinositol alpha-mannosyltransferase
MKKINVGMVCPYGWDTPGGVQTHIRELTQHLLDEGHQVSVFAPVTNEENISDEWLVNAGKPISIPVNGSVARVLFGPIASSRVKQWISQGNFDLLHLHEPAIHHFHYWHVLQPLDQWLAHSTFHHLNKRQFTQLVQFWNRLWRN